MWGKREMSFDTKESIVNKFKAVLGKFFDTLAYISGTLSRKGHETPNPTLISLAKKYFLENQNIDHGDMLLKFAKRFHGSWDKVYSKDYSFIEHNLIKMLGDDLPDYCTEIANLILGAKDADGKTDISDKDVDFLFKILQGFCTLGIKYVFWEMNPTSSTPDGSGVSYTFSKKVEGMEDFNINQEIKLRNVPGLPQNIAMY